MVNNDKSEKQKTNQSNLLELHLQTSEKPLSLGYRFSFMGIIDKTLEQLKLINQATFKDKNPFDELYYDTMMKRTKSKNITNVLAVFNDVTVGALCSHYKEPTKTLYITNIVVLPAWRKLGIGRRLVEKADKIASTFDSCECIKMKINRGDTEAKQFLQHFGFEEEKVEKDSIGFDVDMQATSEDVILVKKVTQATE